MFSGVLAKADRLLDKVIEGLDPACLDGADAKALLGQAVGIKRRAAALELRLAQRVAESNAWRSEGDRSAAHWLARTTGVSVGQAIGMLETAERLADLDTTAEVFRAGGLSEPQVRAIASAAGADPAAEESLLVTAQREGLGELRERCQRVRRAAEGQDARERHERICRERSARKWADADGAGRIDLRGPAEDIARIWAGIQPARQTTFTQAREAGRREPYDAYSFDAFVQTCGDAPVGGDARGRRPAQRPGTTRPQVRRARL